MCPETRKSLEKHLEISVTEANQAHERERNIMMSDFSKTSASLQYINSFKLSVGGRVRDSRKGPCMSHPVSLFTVCHLHCFFVFFGNMST